MKGKDIKLTVELTIPEVEEINELYKEFISEVDKLDLTVRKMLIAMENAHFKGTVTPFNRDGN